MYDDFYVCLETYVTTCFDVIKESLDTRDTIESGCSLVRVCPFYMVAAVHERKKCLITRINRQKHLEMQTVVLLHDR